MRKPQNIKPQDILVLLKLLVLDTKLRYSDLANELGMGQSEISHGMERLIGANLLGAESKEPLRRNLYEFLLYGLKYVYPAFLGAVSRGIPTSHSAKPLSKNIVSSSNEHYVWAHPDGEVRGHSINPLYPSAPLAAIKDEKLYELLSLVDAIRIGQARERKLAEKELEKRIFQ